MSWYYSRGYDSSHLFWHPATSATSTTLWATTCSTGSWSSSPWYFIAYIKYVCFGWSYPADPCKYATSERCVTQLPAASFSFNTHLVKGLFLWMSMRRKVLATTGTPLVLWRRHCSSKVLLLSQVHRFLSHPNQKHCCSLKHLHLPLLAHFFFTFSRLISFSGRLRLWKLHSLI